MPLYEAHTRFVLGSRVLHADETPVALLDPGAGKTKKAYIWAYARGAFDPEPGVVYDFCPGAGRSTRSSSSAKWIGHAGARRVRRLRRGPALRRAHRRRLPGACEAEVRRAVQGQRQRRGRRRRSSASPGCTSIEADARDLTRRAAPAMRQERSKPLWEELHVWLQARAHARARRQRHRQGDRLQPEPLDGADAQFLLDGDVPIDNNHLENQIRPWAMGRRKHGCSPAASWPASARRS